MHVIMCVCVTRLTADIPPLAGLPIPACMHRHDNTWNYMFAGTVEKIPCDAQLMVTSVLYEINSYCSFQVLYFAAGTNGRMSTSNQHLL